MTTLIALIIGIIIGFLLARIFKSSKTTQEKDTRIIKKSEKEKQKHKNINAVLSYLTEHEEISNNDIEKLLNVSDATATRYLDELESQGRIEQHGEKGRFVTYRLK